MLIKNNINWNNKEEVVVEISKNGKALDFASNNLRGDKKPN